MCKFGRELRQGKMYAVLYSDNTASSKRFKKMLDEAGAPYEEADATVEKLSEPTLVVDGSFFDARSVKELLEL